MTINVQNVEFITSLKSNIKLFYMKVNVMKLFNNFIMFAINNIIIIK